MSTPPEKSSSNSSSLLEGPEAIERMLVTANIGKFGFTSASIYHCEKAICRCPYGWPNSICGYIPEDYSAHAMPVNCIDCDFGYSLVDFVARAHSTSGSDFKTLKSKKCVVNKCICQYKGKDVGIPSSGLLDPCPGPGYNKCKDSGCFDGYAYKESSQKCEPEPCNCPNGVPTTNMTACSADADKIMCVKCTAPGYHLDAETKKCELNQCKCEHGQAAMGRNCQIHGNDQCLSCRNGYNLRINVLPNPFSPKNKAKAKTKGGGNKNASSVLETNEGGPEELPLDIANVPRTSILHMGQQLDIDDADSILFAEMKQPNMPGGGTPGPTDALLIQSFCYPQCTCENGKPIKPAPPGTPGETCKVSAEMCEKKCTPGFVYDKFTKTCVPKLCACNDFGKQAASGLECPKYGQVKCSLCPLGFFNPNDTRPGVAPENQPGAENNKTSEESSSFLAGGARQPNATAKPKAAGPVVSKKQCIPKVCRCPHGEPVPPKDCVQDQMVDCKKGKCGVGYHSAPLASDASRFKCEVNKCKCPFGRPAIGAACPKHDSVACIKCSAGTRLFDLPVPKNATAEEEAASGSADDDDEGASVLCSFSFLLILCC